MFILISINFALVFGNGGSTPKRPSLPLLNTNKYTQLKTISDKNIATTEQLRACQKVFEILDERGYHNEFDIIESSLTKILEDTNPSIEQILVFTPLWVACKIRAEEIDIATPDFITSLTDMIIQGIKENLPYKEIATPLIEAISKST